MKFSLKHFLALPVLLLAMSFCAFGQKVAVQDVTGTTNNRSDVRRLIFPNGTLSFSGPVATISGLGASFSNGSVFNDAQGANIFSLGGANSATPTAQSIFSQSGVGTNIAGAPFTLAPGISTGNAVPSLLKFDATALGGSTGTTAQTNVDRLIVGASKILTNNSPINITNVTDASNTNAVVVYTYAVEVFDGTNLQYEGGSEMCGVTNKAAAFSGNTCTKYGNAQNVTSGTLTVTFAITGANPAVVSVNANSSLTPSAGYPRITYSVSNLTQQAVSIQ